MQLLSDLGTDLSGIAVDSLTAAHHDIVLLNTQSAQSGSQDLGSSVGIGTAELTGGNQHALVSAHGHQLTQHTGSGRGAHGDNGDLAAGGVLQLQGGLNSVHIIGVGDGLHGSTVQSAVGIDSHLAGGIGYLLDTNINLHFDFSSLQAHVGGDDDTLDLAGALVDLRDLGVAHHALHGIILGVAVAAEHLQRLGGGLHSVLRAE